MIMLIRLITCALVAATAGCSNQSSNCGDAWIRAKQTPIHLADKRPLRIGTPLFVLAEAHRCFHPSEGATKLVFRGDQFVDNAENRYIVFETESVDRGFVVVISQSGSVIRTGPASLNF
jgi:hypothetical protein